LYIKVNQGGVVVNFTVTSTECYHKTLWCPVFKSVTYQQSTVYSDTSANEWPC